MSSNFNGTWTGSAKASFSAGGFYTYPGELRIAASGEMASITGVCPDGTGLVIATGSGTSASFAGSLTCTSIPIAGCGAVVFTYSRVDVTLTAPTSLNFSATGSATGCDETVAVLTSLVASDILLDAGPPVADWDLRFKGVGHSLVAGRGFGGGPPVGVPGGPTSTWTGPGILAWGLLVEDAFFAGPLSSVSQPALSQATLWLDGATCPDTFAKAVSGNNVVLGVAGNIAENTSCVILGVAQPDAGPTFLYLTEDAVSASHILETLGNSVSGRSFVLTGLFEVDAGLYTYVAESVGLLADGGTEQFETVIDMPAVADVAANADTLADAGYIITASAWRGQPYYTLVGTRTVGSTVSHSTMTIETTLLAFETDLQTLVNDGFAPVSFTWGYTADGGADLRLIGER